MDALDRSTLWPYDERGEPREFHYQRFGSPTVAAAEIALGELDAVGRRARLVELDDAESPRRQRGERDAGAVVPAAGEGDRVARLEQ